MICLYWNIRGITNKESRIALKKMIRKNSPDFIFIVEPWMNIDSFLKSRISRCELKLFASNVRIYQFPNLWCFCKINLDLVIIDIDEQQVSFKINQHGIDFGFSAVYASTNYARRKSLWAKLNDVNHSKITWSFIDDFNVIVSVEEYKVSSTPSKIPISDFFNWIDNNNLIHLPTLGDPFTWCNGRKGRLRTEKRLDKIVCNMEILDLCKHVVCHTLTKTNSDHYPLIYTINLEKFSFKSQF